MISAGATTAPEWIRVVRETLPTDHGPSVVALAQLLRDGDDTPPALRAIAEGFLRTAISVRPRARLTDPATSRSAAETVDVQRRPGGTFHRLLRAYGDFGTHGSANLEAGLTAREAEVWTTIRAAHKRTSDLLRDGLLDVVLDDNGDDLVRDGSRVLAITPAGRTELARLDRAGQPRHPVDQVYGTRGPAAVEE